MLAQELGVPLTGAAGAHQPAKKHNPESPTSPASQKRHAPSTPSTSAGKQKKQKQSSSVNEQNMTPKKPVGGAADQKGPSVVKETVPPSQVSKGKGNRPIPRKRLSAADQARQNRKENPLSLPPK